MTQKLCWIVNGSQCQTGRWRSDARLRFIFHRAVHDIGIDRPRQVIGHMIFASPTPHSLRHSFAVNTLKRVKERGDCPQHALPVLAVYMGHRVFQCGGINHDELYLHTTLPKVGFYDSGYVIDVLLREIRDELRTNRS